MTWSRFLLLFSLSLCQDISRSFEIVGSFDNKSVVEGGNVALHCKLSEVPQLLFWLYRSVLSKEPSFQRVANCVPSDPKNGCQLKNKFADYSELSTNVSSLIFTGIKRRNDGIYRCEAYYMGTEKTAEARLTVLVPPGKPQLALNSSAPLVDEFVKLTCSSTGGNPVPSLTWRWLRPDGTPRPDFSPQLFKPKDVFGTISGEVTTRMSVADHLSTVQCVANNSAGNIASSVLLLEIDRLPGRATIDIDVTQPREGDFVQLRCTSEGGNPKPTITWTWTRADGTSRQLPPETITEPDRPFGIIRSTLRVGLNYTDNQATIRCSAQNRVGNSGTAIMNLQVYYKPRMENFRYSPLWVLESKPLSLRCRVNGNPTPKVTWTTKGRTIHTGSTLTFSQLSRTHSGVYKCLANNTAGSSHILLELRVIYPPSVILPSRLRFREGQQMFIRCQVFASPPASVQWLGPNGKPVGLAGQELRLDNINRQQAGRYECEARNVLRPSEGDSFSRTAKNGTDVVVEYLPSDPNIIFDPPSSVVVGTNVHIQCNANSEYPGYPYPKLELLSLKDNRVLSTNGSYWIRSAILSDSGTYRCTAGNIVGTAAVREMQLQVEEPPKFTLKLPAYQTLNLTSVNKDEDYVRRCMAEGKPLPKITWTRNSVPITGTGDLAIFYQVMLEEKPINGDQTLGYQVTSILRWSGEKRGGVRRTALRPDDNGNYSCIASNSRGNIQSTMQLTVLYAPQFKNPQYIVAGDLGRGVAHLRCPVTSQPPPELTVWYLPDGRMVGDSSVDSRFSVRNENPQLNQRIYTSILTIRSLNKNDFTFYRCYTRNSRGNNTLKVELRNQSKPETPTNFRVDSRTWESAYLSWTPGFNGGSPQTFVIRLEWKNRDDQKLGILRERVNLTNLFPNTTYGLSIAATNKLGTGTFSQRIFFDTEALYIPRIQDVFLDISTKRLRFTAPPGYCIRVDVSRDRGMSWLPFRECLTAGEGSELVSSTAEEYRAALCLPRRPDVCSEYKLAQVSDASPEVSLIVILVVAIACAVLIVLLFVVLIFFCIRRRPRRKNFEENVAHRRPQAVTINPYAPTPPSTGPALHHSPPCKPFALVTPTSGGIHPPNNPAYENGAASFGQDDGECGRSSRGRASPWETEKRNKTSTFGDSASVLTPHSNSSQDPLLASNADPPPYTDTIRRAPPRQSGLEMQTIAIRDDTGSVFPTRDLTSPRSMTISRSALSSPIPSATLQLTGGTCPRQPKKVIYEVVV